MSILLKENMIRKTTDFFLKRPEVKFAYLFGSVALGKGNQLSDVDLAVFIDGDYLKENKFTYGYKAELITELIKVLRTNNVDLVILNTVPVLLKHKVLVGGKLLVCRDD
ncbi:MAG: nucleotidyltransferase domain-containing protein, partial [Candidatus Omnitrophica bacterium]|nr:nucleotidyltransferase domain-containing protein [Candidatus Omnitrophota bacterium]